MGETTDLVGIELVHRASPAPRDEWEEVLRADPLALETQSAAWTDAMCASGRFEDASRLYVGRGGRKLVLPMLRRSLAGRAVAVEGSQPPHCGVGGVLAPRGATPAGVPARPGRPPGRPGRGPALFPHPPPPTAPAAPRPPH